MQTLNSWAFRFIYPKAEIEALAERNGYAENDKPCQ